MPIKRAKLADLEQPAVSPGSFGGGSHRLTPYQSPSCSRRDNLGPALVNFKVIA